MNDPRRWALAVALALAACAGAAAGAELLGEPSTLPVSAAPDLLGPITEVGRAGWNCAPEHAATARTAAAAGLPQD